MEIATEIREQYLHMLRNNICVVTFTKRDGTERIMRCTLKSDLLPTPATTKPITEVKVRKTNPNTLAVWDLDKSAWRGFSVEQIKEIKQES
jgi:hypothetical protein